MSSVSNAVPVLRTYFNLAVAALEKEGLIEADPWNFGQYVCVSTRRTVAASVDDSGGPVLDEDVFAGLTVTWNSIRPLTGTEYEMICKKLEARSTGNLTVERDVFLPPWTQPVYDSAVAAGLGSFRGRSSWVEIPHQMTFAQGLDASREVVRGRADAMRA